MASAISGVGMSPHLSTRSPSRLHIPALRCGRIANTSRKALSPVTLRATLAIRCNQNLVSLPDISCISAGSSSQNPDNLSKTPSTFNTILSTAGVHHVPILYKKITVDDGNGGIGGDGGRRGGGGGGGDGGGEGVSKSSLSAAANSDEDRSQETSLSAVYSPASVFMKSMSSIGISAGVSTIPPFHGIGGDVNSTKDQLQKLLEMGSDLVADGTVVLKPIPKGAGKINFESFFSNPQFSTRRDGGFTFVMKQDSDEVDTEYSIMPGPGGLARWSSLLPGGTLSFEQRNVEGLHTSINGSVSTSNLLNPQDDIVGKVEYVHPFLRNTLRASSFNTRKILTGVDQDPSPICIDRAGIKINNTEIFSPRTELMYGMTLEEIATRQLQVDHMDDITGTGDHDQLLYAQANLTRDDSKFVNGALVGNKTVLQVDQGLGLCKMFPFFNRHQLKMTRFIQLKKVEEGAGKPSPPVAVLHGRFGGCAGHLPKHDLFALGGPYSVRGYNTGEIAFSRYILELAAEIRVPVKNGLVYAFAEHGNNLGSSRGSSYGVGAKLGFFRAEYAVNNNPRSAALFFRFGDRF